MHSELFQRWVTIVGTGPAVLSITQDEEDWIDLSDSADAAFWIDVRQAQTTVSSGPAIVYLYVETAPFKDEALFLPAAPAVALTASASPLVTLTARGATSVAPLARWVRWRLAAPGATGTWDATFRIRVARSKTAFFAPTHLPGCVLWLRSDVGVVGSPAAMAGTISAWNDQSGQGNNATVPSGTVPYSATGGLNGFPIIGSASNTDVLTGTFNGTFGTAHTLFNVNAYTPGQFQGAFSGTDGTFDNHSGFAQYAVSDSNNIVGEVSNGAGSVTLAETTSLPAGMATGAIYSTAANTSAVDLYVNGTLMTSTPVSFTPESPTNYLVLAQWYTVLTNTASNPLANPAYEFIVYNRVLSAAERIVVHRYLGGRYGISVP